MSDSTMFLKQYLEYIRNTGGNATVAIFDDDWEPIGPMVRRIMIPTYAVVRDGKLELTEAGRRIVAA